MKRYSVGIDLGTTNTVVAYADSGPPAGAGTIRLFDIEQLVAPGEVKALPLLPSVRYHAAPGELAAGELLLPWPDDGTQNVVSGQLARKLGAQVPGRLVASAKSWLSHAGVDRLAPILPWGAAADIAKVSPMAASASYLAHVRAAWNWRFPGHPLEQQDVVLTVPASFDDGARALTLAAARAAGLGKLRLLEEPQAVLYDWLFRHRDKLAAELEHTRLVLVCDVGGGTTDLSLIKVDIHGGQPRLTRIAVGNHLMLGGDNMDLALAHVAEARLAPPRSGSGSGPGPGPGQTAARLSAADLSQLMERCRAAKETLLAAGAPQQVALTLLGAGARLIQAARTVELTREEVEQLIVDGFFPLAGSGEEARRGRGGIVEFGLPYARDPAITRHVASFLRQHAAAAREAMGSAPGEAMGATAGAAVGGAAGELDELVLPDTLLLNGGVFRADALVRRLTETLASWRGAPLRLLHNDNPDVAVARGAVAYAMAGQGQAPRIVAGAARNYFLLLDDEPRRQTGGGGGGGGGGAVPRRAICILPRGSEPGREILLQDRTFTLRVGRPVRFHLLSSTADDGHAPRAGELIDVSHGNYVRLPPVAMVLPSGPEGGRKDIPVHLATALSELGTLEVHCVAVTGTGTGTDAGTGTDTDIGTGTGTGTGTGSIGHPGLRWLLEFQLRGAGGASSPQDMDEAFLAPGFTEAVEKIERIFGPRAQHVAVKDVRQLRQHLEHVLGSREGWKTPLLRHLFDALMQRARGRRRSAEHERAWLNLAGYCLRPGFGYPLDDWRIEQLWPLFEHGVQHANDSQVDAQWWTLWRRVAGGLDGAAQLRILDDFAFNLQESEAKSGPRPANLVKGSHEDMLRLGASLERIPPEHKVEIGAWLLEQIGKSGAKSRDSQVSGYLWALARIAARQPFHGNAHDVVPPGVASGWLATLLALDWKRVEPAAFAAAHMARLTGDRARDLPLELREQLIRRLKASGAPATWIAMLEQVVQLDEADERRLLGEALPPGLKLIV